MDLATATLEQFQALAFILIRVGTLVLAAPVLGHARIPPQVKIAFTLVLGVLLLMTLNARGVTLPERAASNVLSLAGSAAGELFVGLLIAYSAYLFFTAVQMAGQVVDIQIGFGLVNVIDPASNIQVSIMGQFYYLLALLYFLALDGHHHLLAALGESFSLIPPGSLSWTQQAAAAGPKLAEFFTRLFGIALQVAGPSVAALFLANLSMGLLSRTLPQMNVFIVGLPLNILVGLGISILSLKLMGAVLSSVVGGMQRGIAALLAQVAG